MGLGAAMGKVNAEAINFRTAAGRGIVQADFGSADHCTASTTYLDPILLLKQSTLAK